MSLVNAATPLADIVLEDPSVVTVLNRFGIALGLGDATIESACLQLGIDREFFAAILNTYINEAYFPQKILAGFSAATVIDYLNKTNDYYEQFQLPNIERHLYLLTIKTDPAASNLDIISDFFTEVKRDLLARIDNDRRQWFPEVLANEQQHRPDAETPITDFEGDADSVEDKLNDLLSLFVVHLQGDYDHNLGLAVLLAIFSLRKDIAQNNRIRNRILRPISRLLSRR